IGAHVSAAKGVENAVGNAEEIGATAFALFLKSQRKWVSPPIKDASKAAFREKMAAKSFSPKHILPHGSYLINLGNPDRDKREKSYECFLDDLQRCEQLGLALYNFHPGSTVGSATPEESVTLIAECLNRAHKATKSVVTVIENMAGAGNIIGSDFAQIAQIIAQVEDKLRVGVCIDTCKYDFPTCFLVHLKTFDEHVGIKYLRGMHLNDSKTPLGSRRDRHENIGLGHIGLAAFYHIVRDERLQDIPLILETPTNEQPAVWKTEID
ncbi:AP endonuclease, partial [Fistulina hepatica ATCC 64428]